MIDKGYNDEEELSFLTLFLGFNCKNLDIEKFPKECIMYHPLSFNE